MALQRTLTFSALTMAVALSALAEDGLKPRDLTPVTWLEAPAHPPVEIVRDGKAQAVVYVADPKGWVKPDPQNKGKNIPNVKRLIDQLVEVVRVSTGATLELVDASPAANRPAIVIGDCEETRQAGIEAEQLPVEGFVVKTAPQRVYLVGSTRHGRGNDGAAWAVADFLERFVGVRWYWPTQYGGRSVPPAPRWPSLRPTIATNRCSPIGPCTRTGTGSRPALSMRRSCPCRRASCRTSKRCGWVTISA